MPARARRLVRPSGPSGSMNVRNTLLIPTCLLVLCACAAAVAAQASDIHLEAEDAQLSGAVSRATTRPWYNGSGYVTGFAKDADKISLKTSIDRAGLYSVRIRYCAPSGRKGYYL